MKKLAFVGLLGLGLIFGSAVAQDDKAAPKGNATPPAAGSKDLKSKVSYSIGLQMGQNLGKSFKAQEIDLDNDSILKGISDGLRGAKPSLSDAEMKEVLASFEKDLMSKREAMAAKAEGEAAAAGARSKKEGDAYLAANKGKPGVKTLPSGLQYKVLKEGTGATPKLSDTVKAHYTGKLIDGTVFDSSVKRGQPADFPVQGVIPGWTEALQLMKVGSKWELFIPANLAYGERGRPGAIPPNSVLVFEVELLGIE